MKKIIAIPFLLLALFSKAQLLSWTPDFIKEISNPVTITVDANFGNKGLLNYTPLTDVYVHIGVITNKSASSSDWKHVPFTWGTTNALAQCTSLGSNKWKFTINGGLRSFFSITDPTETIQKIAILFRSGNGSKVQRNADGSDMYVPVYDNGVYARIDLPYKQPTYVPIPEAISKKVGDNIDITAKSSVSGTLKIIFNGTELTSTSSVAASASPVITSTGDQQIIASASDGSTTRNDTMNFVVAPSNNIAELPAGTSDGINYEQGDTSAVLVLYAPGKSNIFVLGDFNNWTASVNYLMNITPDGKRFWIRLTGLTPGTEYAYQYLIDGNLKVADFNTEKILDPSNDQYISSTTYPNLKPYPTGKTTGIVSILQTAKPSYNWQVTNFNRPNKSNLMIYELLVRDFTAAGNWQTLTDTLSYLKRLGINAIEVMPFNEFEGNNSWGYNPSFYFAPDKAYGTETALKTFIDQCHQQGFAVIMDIAMNHSFGSSPMVQMCWDAANSRPATNNPWFNPVPKHAYNVGYDMNHESQATKDFVNRVIRHWLINYKIDGFRWDLSKGFTQTQTCDANGNNCDVSAWGHYDTSRVNIWKTYYNDMQDASTNSYCILEHFADDNEEVALSNYGMLLWGNMNYAFNQSTMGYVSGSDFSRIIYSQRGWTKPNLVGYMESHDEERLMYKNEQYGAVNGSYNVKTISTGLKRNGMAAAFWAMVPGPKMLWQFGELGYDYSINYCENGTISDACRLSPKPIRWDYYNNTDRKALYDVYSKLLRLRNTPNYISTFTTGTVTQQLSTLFKSLSVSDDSLKVVVYGNFDVTTQTANITFPATGTWYSFLNDSTANITSTTVSITLPPGAYYVFTNKNIKEQVLPVKLLSFTAEKTTAKNVLLKWSTSNEINNGYFEIERSADGIHFFGIGKINAQSSNAAVKQYSFTDMSSGSVNYYRLKQVDKNGATSYSSVIKLSFDNGVHWQVYPNPVKNNAYLYLQEDVSNMQVTLRDISGKTVYSTAFDAAVQNQKLIIPLNHLSKGTYFITISTNKGISTQKLIVQ